MKRSGKVQKKVTYIVFLGVFILFSVCSAYVLLLFYRSYRLYSSVKASTWVWKGRMYQFDREFGFKPIPNSKGSFVFPTGEEVPMQHDSFGFRVPAGQKSISYQKRPILLFLGCSFTYGQASLAEEAFPYLVGEYLKGSSINAGGNGYGLTQMVILARKLIPKYKPDYVIVQYTLWLTDRAINPHASIYRIVPQPYIASVSGKNKIITPPSSDKFFDTDISRYKTTKKSFYEYISFLKVGMPLFVHNDYVRALTKIKLVFNIIPEPNRNRTDAEKYAYNEIYKLCKQNNSRMLLLLLWNRNNPENYVNAIEGLQDVTVVDADAALWNKLSNINDEDFAKNYSHWGGNPHVIVDSHPNAKAHKIIADEIYKNIVNQN